MTQEVFVEAQIFWMKFGALATAATGVLYLIILVVLIVQVWLQRRAVQAQMFASFFTRNQDKDLLDARRALYDKAGMKPENPEGWGLDETQAAEKACNAFDITGILADLGYMDRGPIVKHWRGSLIRTWEAARPVIELRRRQTPEYWKPFEKLVEVARQKEDEGL
jgi:hypothetical protein